MTAYDPSETGLPEAYVWVISILCGIAVLLNLLVIVVVIKYGKYQASIDIFLTNLAASDIIHAGVVTPVHFKNVSAYHQDFYGSNLVCKIIMFLPLISVCGAIFSVVAIGVDRYRMILTHKQLGQRGAIIAVIVIWIASIFVSAPQLYEYNVYEVDQENEANTTIKSCGSEGIVEHFETIYASLVIVFAYLVPLIVLSVCYTKILLHVWKHGKRFRRTQMMAASELSSCNSMTTTTSERINNMLTTRTMNLLKLLITITTTFVALWTPYFLIFGMTEIMGSDDSSNHADWPHMITRTMTTLSTITNPVLYLVFSDTFREKLEKVLSCCCIRRGKANSEQENHVSVVSYNGGHSQKQPRVEPMETVASL